MKLFYPDWLSLPVMVLQWIILLRRLLYTSASQQIAFRALALKCYWLCFIISFNRNSVSWRLQLSFLFVWKAQNLTAVLLVSSEAGKEDAEKHKTRDNTLWQTFLFSFVNLLFHCVTLIWDLWFLKLGSSNWRHLLLPEWYKVYW